MRKTSAKQVLAFGVFLLSPFLALPQAYLGQLQKDKQVQSVAAIRLSHSQKEVETGLKAYLSARGYRSSSTHGYIVFRGVALNSASPDAKDLYFMLETPSRKEKDLTLLSLLPVQKDQPANRPAAADSVSLDPARIFLDSLAPFIGATSINMQVSMQEDQLHDAKRKMDKLRNDQSSLQKRLRDLQSDLAQNQSAQSTASTDLNNNLNSDSDTKKKYQKRLNNLIDKQESLEKKIRQAQTDLSGNSTDQQRQQTQIDQLQQTLDALKARQAH